MRLCQISGGNGTTINNNKSKTTHLSTNAAKQTGIASTSASLNR
jgi:hypothetical protein